MGETTSGARGALAGYLYQFLVTAGCALRWDATDSGNGDLDDCLLWAERLGQDIAEQTGRKLKLIQVKHSLEDETIGAAELVKKIAKPLWRSATRAESAGCRVVAYSLVTNRRMPDSNADTNADLNAMGLLSVARDDDPDMVRKATDRVSKILEEKKENKDAGGGDDAPSVGNVLRVLKELKCERWPGMRALEQELRRYAATFGASATDIRKGIRQFCGDMLMRTASQPDLWLEEADLREAFTQSRNAQPLVPESIIEVSRRAIRDGVDHWSGKANSVLPPKPIPRQCDRDLDDAVREEGQALILVVGEGGCGKTVALWEWAKGMVGQAEPDVCANTAVTVAGLPEDWIARTVRCWGGHTEDSSWLSHYDGRLGSPPWETAIRRLRCAADTYGAPRPFLFLGIDALDETPAGKRGELRRLLQWFYDGAIPDAANGDSGALPHAKLVVTLRRRDEVTLRDWLAPTADDTLDLDRVHIIRVERFSRDELAEAAAAARRHPQWNSSCLSETAEMDIAAACRPVVETLQHGSASPGLGSTVGPQRQMPTGLPAPIEALRHPIVWKHFLQLSEQLRTDYLDGQPQASDRLADAYVQWALDKACRRHDELPPIGTTMAKAALEAVVDVCSDPKRNYERRSDWWDPMVKAALPGLWADALYMECSVSGVILDTGHGRWRWAHPFVHSHLRRDEGGQSHA